MKHTDIPIVIAACAALISLAQAQTPLQDIGFTATTPLPDADAVIVREKALVGPVDLSAYGMGAGHDYVQSIYFRFFTDANASTYASFTGRIAFPPNVTVLGIITNGTQLGGELDDGQWTASDALFGIGSDPDAYSAYARGFDSTGSEFVCQTSASAVVFGLNITNGVDDIRVIVDYGSSFPPQLAFDVASNDVPNFGTTTPSAGFQIGDVVNPVVLGSGDFGEVGSVLRIPLTASVPTNAGAPITADLTHLLWILRDTSPDNFLDAFDYVLDLPEPEAITLLASVVGTPVGLAGGPDGRLYSIGSGTGYASIDLPSRSVTAGTIPDLAGSNVELTGRPFTRELLFARDTTGDTFVDRFDVDAQVVVQSLAIPSAVVGTPVGVAVGVDGFAYVLGGGGGFARLDLGSGAVTSFPLSLASGYSYGDLAAASASPELFLVRSNNTTTVVDRFDLALSSPTYGFATTTVVGTAAGITEGPQADLYVVGIGSSGAAGFARVSNTTGAVLESNVCMDFPGNNIDIAFVVPFQSEIYCTAKTNSQGCVPAIASSGLASATNPSPFVVSAGLVLNNKSGILFYGLAPNSASFQGGILCVKQPVRRTPIQGSGGNPPPDDCSGVFAYDFNALIQSGADPSLAPPTEVFGQYWYRDPADPTGFTTGLSDGLRFTIAP